MFFCSVCGCFWWVFHNFSGCVSAAVLGSAGVLVCFGLWVLGNLCWVQLGFYVGVVVGAFVFYLEIASYCGCADVQIFAIAPLFIETPNDNHPQH